MTNGEWVFDGTPISFDKYGNLLNGQHRLSSVIKSGKSNILRLLLVLNQMFSQQWILAKLELVLMY
jgi:hypothetical protein